MKIGLQLRRMNPTARLMHGAAALLLGALWVWGAVLYPDLPDVLPTHWNLGGQADGFSAKSLWSVSGTVMVATATALFVFLVQVGVRTMRHLAPSERRAMDLTFGYVNLSLVAIMGWTSLAGWYDLSVGPLFIALALMAGVPVLIIFGLHLPTIMKERKALADPADPSLDPRYWVLGGIFYSNPKDRRAFVPRPPHTGSGLTMNLATPGGCLALIGVLVVLVGSLALVFVL